MSIILNTLIKATKQQIILPFYHLVTDKTPNFIKHLYQPKTIVQFKNDLEALLKHYSPISLQELILINQGKKNVLKPSFHLTFDDGLSNFYKIIAPILIEKNISATIFLNTDFVDNTDLFYRYKTSLLLNYYINSDKKNKKIYHDFFKNNDIKQILLAITFQNKKLLDKLAEKLNYSFSNFLEKEKPYLTLIQIKELQKKGFTFGTHSSNHPFYANLTLEKQFKQTITSIKWIQDNLNINYKVFSFPFSDIGVSKTFFDKIKPTLDLSFGTSGIKKDEIGFNLHRLDMEKSKTNVVCFLKTELLKYLIKIPFGKNKIKRIK
ncbi:MAG: polysaccharide deacetylase family protein [Flavobacteriaceae bacterium]|nr:polysaccharide deacetylase family protein [Flavobacteriaceae bacterium]